MTTEEFIKSYETDYFKFKQRIKEAGLGGPMDAQNYWRYLLGSNKSLKDSTIKKLKNHNIEVKDLNTLRSILD